MRPEESDQDGELEGAYASYVDRSMSEAAYLVVLSRFLGRLDLVLEHLPTSLKPLRCALSDLIEYAFEMLIEERMASYQTSPPGRRGRGGMPAHDAERLMRGATPPKVPGALLTSIAEITAEEERRAREPVLSAPKSKAQQRVANQSELRLELARLLAESLAEKGIGVGDGKEIFEAALWFAAQKRGVELFGSGVRVTAADAGLGSAVSFAYQTLCNIDWSSRAPHGTAAAQELLSLARALESPLIPTDHSQLNDDHVGAPSSDSDAYSDDHVKPDSLRGRPDASSALSQQPVSPGVPRDRVTDDPHHDDFAIDEKLLDEIVGHDVELRPIVLRIIRGESVAGFGPVSHADESGLPLLADTTSIGRAGRLAQTYLLRALTRSR